MYEGLNDVKVQNSSRERNKNSSTPWKHVHPVRNIFESGLLRLNMRRVTTITDHNRSQ